MIRYKHQQQTTKNWKDENMQTRNLSITENTQALHAMMKSNDIIKALTKLTVTEQRLFILLSSQVHKDDEHFKTYEITVDELVTYLGTSAKTIYNNFDKVTKDFMKKLFEVKTEDGGYKVMHFVETAIFKKQYANTSVQLKISEDMKPYLLDVKNFVHFKIANVLSFKSQYALPFYELLKYSKDKLDFSIKQYDNAYDIAFTLDEIKEFLDIQDVKAYERFPNLKARVIDKVIDDINKYADLNISYEPITRARKTIALKFNIEYKQNEAPEVVEQPQTPNEESKQSKQPIEFKRPNVNQLPEFMSNDDFLKAFGY